MEDKGRLRIFAMVLFLLIYEPLSADSGWVRLCDYKPMSRGSDLIGISELHSQLMPPFSLASTLDEIHNSYSFFKFPVYDEGTPRLKEVCPNFRVMNREDKEKFWKNFWTQLAQFESSREMVPGKAIHGDACGYLQLPCELAARKAKVRPEFQDQCSGDIMSNNLSAGVNNLRCGMALLQTQIDGANEIFPDKKKQKFVYWSPLRKPELMYHKVCNFQGCGNTPAICNELLKKREQELK